MPKWDDICPQPIRCRRVLLAIFAAVASPLLIAYKLQLLAPLIQWPQSSLHAAMGAVDATIAITMGAFLFFRRSALGYRDWLVGELGSIIGLLILGILTAFHSISQNPSALDLSLVLAGFGFSLVWLQPYPILPRRFEKHAILFAILASVVVGFLTNLKPEVFGLSDGRYPIAIRIGASLFFSAALRNSWKFRNNGQRERFVLLVFCFLHGTSAWLDGNAFAFSPIWWLSHCLRLVGSIFGLWTVYDICSRIFEGLQADTRHLEKRLQRMLKGNLIGVVFFDDFGMITEANDAFLESVGYSRENVLRRELRWHNLTKGSWSQSDYQIFRQIQTDGVVQPFERSLLKKDGSMMPSLMGAARLEGDKPENVAYVLDISELRRAIQSRDDLMTIASHEIRTPITAMKFQAQLMKRLLKFPDAQVSTKINTLTDQLDSQLSRLARLVDDMLDVSKINGGAFTLNRLRLDLTELTTEAVERLRPHIQDKHCQLQIISDGPVWVDADPMRVEQMLANLVTNAVRYGGGSPIHVSVAATPSGLARLQVRDHGAGISKIDQARIFEKFERASDESSGLGIGLYVVREIANAHGGSVTVESDPGHGAAFSVDLPSA